MTRINRRSQGEFRQFRGEFRRAQGCPGEIGRAQGNEGIPGEFRGFQVS